MANIVVVLIGNIVDLVHLVVDAGVANPISIVLVVAGLLVWAVAFGLFGYLTIGGLFSGATSGSTGRTPPRRGE